MALEHEAPDDTLLGELESVSEDARDLIDFLRRQNTLPATFPTETMVVIAQSLVDLPKGSAEGCHKPLEYARARLPFIRREHFLRENTAATLLDDEEEPPLLRGMTLDRLTINLIASVTTALDEYRNQAMSQFDDTVQVEPTAELDDMTGGQAIATSVEVEAKISATAVDISENLVAGSKNGDRLIRRLFDATSIIRAARAELQFKHVVLRWYRGLVAGVQALPKLIGAAGRAIKLGVDIARPLGNWWHDTEGRLMELSFNEIERFGDALKLIEENLGSRGKHGRLPAGDGERDPRVIKAEKEARRLMLAGEAPPLEVGRLVARLDLAGELGAAIHIPNPGLLAYYPNLRDLDIRFTSVLSTDDLHILSGLTRLTSLKVSPVDADNIDALAKLTNLTSLIVYDNQAVSIDSLGNLTNLTSLWVNANQAVSIDGLGNLTNLTFLRVQTNQAVSIDALAKLTKLTSLYMQAHQVASIDALALLTNLTSLTVEAHHAESIDALAELTNLTSLTLHANQVASIDALARLTNLTSLAVEAHHAESIDALAELTNLTSLRVQANQAVSIDALAELTNLTSLTVHANQEASIDALRGLKKLTKLSLQLASADSLKSLAELADLETLTISSMGKIDLEPLRDLKNLKHLNVRGIQVSDWSPVEHVPNVLR